MSRESWLSVISIYVRMVMEHATLNGILKEVPKPVQVKDQPPTKGLLIQKPSKRVAGSVL